MLNYHLAGLLKTSSIFAIGVRSSGEVGWSDAASNFRCPGRGWLTKALVTSTPGVNTSERCSRHQPKGVGVPGASFNWVGGGVVLDCLEKIVPTKKSTPEYNYP